VNVKLAILAVMCMTAGLAAFGQRAVYQESKFLQELPDVIARIEGEEITAAELRQAVRLAAGRRLQQQGAPQQGNFQPFTPAQEYNFIRMLLEARAARILAAESGVAVPDEEVDKQVQDQIEQVGEERFDELLDRTGMSREDYGEMIRLQRLQRAYARELVDDVTISEEDIRAAYDQLKQQGQLSAPDRSKLQHVLVRVEGEEEAAWDEGRAKIEVVRERIVEEGEDFGEVAEEVSDDPMSAGRGGQVILPKTGRDTTFNELAFSLEPGEISEPFRSEAGWHIMRVEKRFPAGDLTYEEAKDRIEDTLLQRKRVEELRKHILSKMQEMDFEILVEEPGAAVQQDPGLNEDALKWLLEQSS